MEAFRVGGLLDLQRRAVSVDPLESYVEIGVRSFGRGIFHKEPVSGAALGEKRVFWIEPGDLVFNNVFAWEGAVAIASAAEAGTIGSHRFLTYRVHTDLADPSYLRSLFTSELGVRLLGEASPGSAGRNRTLAIDRFAAVEIELPKLDEQRRVAATLDTVFAGVRDALAGMIASQSAVVALRRAALRSAFHEIADRAPMRAITEVLDLNPEAASPVRDGTTFTYIDIGSIKNGTGRIVRPITVTAADAPSRARRRLRAGDVVVSTVRPNLRGTALIPPELDGAIGSTGLAVLRPKPGLDSEFLLLQALSDPFVDQLTGEARGGHYPAVNDARLRCVEIVVPPEAEQRETVARLRSTLGQIDQLADLRVASQMRLRALESSVMNTAFDGTL